MTKTSAKTNYKNLVTELQKDFGVKVPKEEETYALTYIKNHYDSLHSDTDYAKSLGMSPHEYALATIGNGINDGEHMDGVETTDLGNGLAVQVQKEQEIIEVDQNTLKKALKSLLTKENDFLGMLYAKWEEYNEEFFFGQLSYPLMTIEKLNNRTLGNYTHGEDQMGITNHIRFNRNFISLNTEERILETLRHEMIHQWQDEVLYYSEGAKKAKDIKYYIINEDGEKIVVETRQKKRPKDWHNKDFKEFAKVVGIPARGDKCYGNPAKMPEPQSYNRKFVCACIASNGYPLTIWSTRAVHARCKICGKDYQEIKKGGKVIRVEQSHVEKPGEDAVEIAHKSKYTYFKRFESKELKDEFVEHYNETEEFPMTDMVEGVYQKNHNKYKEGFTHWVAYNTAEVNPDKLTNKEVKVEVPKKKEQKPAPKKKPSKKASEEPKTKKPKAPKKTAKKEEPKEPEAKTEEPKEKEPMPADVIKLETGNKERSYKNADDLIDLYREFGSIKGIAEFFGIAPGTIIYNAKKLGVDFKKVNNDEK